MTMTEVGKELLDARRQAIEARMDGRIAAIEGRFDRILATMERLEGQFTEVRKESRADNKTTRITIIVTGITVVLGIAAFNATVLSDMVASFESGRNTALAIAGAMAQAHPGAK